MRGAYLIALKSEVVNALARSKLSLMFESSYGFNRQFALHSLKSRHNEKLNMGITFHI